LIGGGGEDTADYSDQGQTVTVRLDGSAPSGGVYDGAGDTLREIEDAAGGTGDDTLIGNDVTNRLDGGDGNDTIDARGAGNDFAACGFGSRDRAILDQDDQATDCETIETPPVPVVPTPVIQPIVPSPAAPLAALTLTLGPSKLPTLARGLSKGISVAALCSRACKLSASLTLNAATARHYKLSREVAKGATGNGVLALRFTSAAKRALKHARRLQATLAVTATGADGKVAVARRTITLKG
jgi:Ca2+-binding RTX toxin-like protein